MMNVRHLLQRKGPDTWTISPEASVYSALELLAEKNIGALPVVSDGKLVGILSERDYARKVVLQGKKSQDTQVKELMTAKVYHVKPNRTIDECMRLMTDRKIRHLPVVEGGELIGIITIGDVVSAVIADQAHTIRDLEGYITGSMHGATG